MREQIKARFGGVIGMSEKMAGASTRGILKKKFDEDKEEDEGEEYDVEEVSDN